MSLFSIITICYNSEKTIERTIKSVLAQTCKDYEYIIVDGASKDSTLDIVKRYAPMFEGRMKWKSEPDKGIYNAMNKGIKRASGDIIGIVNSDDWLEPDALENVQKSVTANGNDLNSLYCGGINYHLANGEIKKWPVNIKALHRDARLYIISGIRHPGLFVPANVYNELGVFNDQMKMSADLDFMLRCYWGGKTFLDIHSVISNMTEGGLSTSGSKKAREYSRSDRKLMLKNFGKTGLSYYWLFYSWYTRGLIRRVAKKMKLYK